MVYCINCNIDVEREGQPCKFGFDWPCACAAKDTQAGPLMVRHIIDGHEVLLPVWCKLHPPYKEGDEIDASPISGGCYD